MPRTRETIVIPSTARVAEIPAPPLPLAGTRLEIWESMWAQPIATLWDVADLAALCRLVIMQTTVESYSKGEVLREMRQLEDRFLLNPYARAQMRIVIGDEEPKNGNSNVTWFEDAQARLRGAG